MRKKAFTNEEAEMLRSNPYTYAATPHILSFTKEFKELFWEECQAGTLPRQILEKHGYPADVLGRQRIWGIAHTIKGQHYSGEGLREGSLPKSPSSGNDGKATEETIRQLQGEVQCPRQEIGFLKKISSVRTARKQAHCL